MKITVCLVVAVVCLVSSSASAHPGTLQSRPSQEQTQTEQAWVIKNDPTTGGGAVLRAAVNKQWDVSKDGKVKAEVHSLWQKSIGGPDGWVNQGVGGSIRGSWG